MVAMVWVCAGQAAPATRPLMVVTPLPEEARVEQVVGRDLTEKWEGVRIDARVVRMDPVAMKGAGWEVRTADEKRRVAVLPMPWVIDSGSAAVDGADRDFRISKEQAAQLAPAGDGAFVAAWILDGERRSNVVKVTVDGKHALKDEPVLRLTIAEPTVSGRLPPAALTAVRREEKDPAPTLIDLMMASLEVDGKPALDRGGFGWGGRNPQLRVGEWESRMVALERFGVKAGALPGKAAVVVMDVKSEPVTLPRGTPLGDAWDAATAALGK
jgi:hypothetical protein